MQGQPRWERFAQGADILGVRGRGPTLASAFEQTALALSDAVAPLDRTVPELRVELACSAPGTEALLASWIEALVDEMRVRQLVFSRFHVELGDGILRAWAWGEHQDPLRHGGTVTPRTVVRGSARVHEDVPGRWRAQCVVRTRADASTNAEAIA